MTTTALPPASTSAAKVAVRWPRSSSAQIFTDFTGKGKVIRAKNSKHYPPDKGAAELLLKKLDPKVYNPRMIFEGDPSKPVQFIMLNRLPEEPAT